MSRRKANVYDFPRYYDLVYGSDWKAEYDFLIDCFERYAEIPVKRVFEPACGTGRLLYRLGKKGYEVGGLDLNEKAIEYCNDRMERHGLPRSVWVGNMADFRLPGKVEAAFNMINSFRHLTEEADAQQHLASISRALRKGGIYVLGLHLTPTRGQPMDEECWSAQRGQLMVNTRLWTERRDMRLRREYCEMVYDVYTPTRHDKLVDQIVFRTYTAAQLEALLDTSPALEVAGIHDFSYDLDHRVRVDEETEDIVVVLRKS